jgi:hypothetical protein
LKSVNHAANYPARSRADKPGIVIKLRGVSKPRIDQQKGPIL